MLKDVNVKIIYKSIVLAMLLNLSFFNIALAEYSLPFERNINWEPGVEGGIPDRPAVGAKTISVDSYGAVTNDSISDSSAISSALAAAREGDVVEFSSGEYILSSSFTIANGVTVRGQGMDDTILTYTGTGGTIISAGPSDSCAWNDKWCQQVSLVADGSKGDTSLLLDANDVDLGNFEAGDIIVVSMDNAGLDWVDMGDCTWNALKNDAGGSASYYQTVEVVSRSGNTLNISPALYTDMPTSQNAFVGRSSASGNYHEYVGIEDLTLKRTEQPSGQTSMIQYTHCKNSWVKGVEIDKGHGRMINLLRSYQITIQGCNVHHGFVYTSGALNYHYVIGPGTARSLVTDNISCYTNKSVQLESTGGGNVVSYNYLDGSWVNESNPYWQGQDIGSHCAHAHHDLIEGNWFNRFNNDAIHGSASHFVLFRNYIDSDHDFTTCQADHPYQDTQSIAAVAADSGYYLSVVGNILGKAGRSNIYECNPSSSCATSEGNNHIYMFRTGDNTAPSPYSTILRHHNYDYVNNAVINNGSDDTSLPSSMYLSSKPQWWDEQGSGRPWPPISADDPGGVVDIPAKDRYEGEFYSAQNEPVLVRADVNQDNSTNITDALLILRYSLGLSMIETAWQFSATTGDVNCDANTNTIDALSVLRYSLGLDMGSTSWCIK